MKHLDGKQVLSVVSGASADTAGAVPRTYSFCHPPVLHFGDPGREYHAARETAAVFDLSDRTQLEITGADRQRFLNNYCTNDIKRLGPGTSCEAFVTNAKSRILGHVFVFASADSFWVESGPGADETLMAHFGRYIISADVQLHNRSAEYGELLLTGPTSAQRLARLDIDCAALPPHRHLTVERNDCRLDVRRVDLLGQPGLLLSTARTKLARLWQELIASGVAPAGAVAFHACRIEAGFPLYGLDLSDDHLAPEAARSAQAISLTKGCYLGQEPIARIDALGHVNRELRGLRLEEGPMPEPGALVLSTDGREVGTITSAAMIPETNRPIALAMLRSSHTTPATAVRVRVGDCELSATVY